MTPRFVWLLENGFATCAKLPADCPCDGIRLKDTGLGTILLAEHKLDADQEGWSLSALAQQFPPPEPFGEMPVARGATEIEITAQRPAAAISGIGFWEV